MASANDLINMQIRPITKNDVDQTHKLISKVQREMLDAEWKHQMAAWYKYHIKYICLGLLTVYLFIIFVSINTI